MNPGIPWPVRRPRALAALLAGLLAGLAGTLPAGPLLAQGTPGTAAGAKAGPGRPDPGPPARGPVDLEIIVFRQRGGGGTAVPGPAQPGPVAALGPGELRLTGARQRLAASGRISPVAHLGWRLDPQGQGQSPALPVTGSGLAGQVRLYRQGSLYLEVDVALEDSPGLEGGGSRARIGEIRRVRSEGLIYLDHTDFGIIAQVRGVAPVEGIPAPGSGPGTSGRGSR